MLCCVWSCHNALGINYTKFKCTINKNHKIKKKKLYLDLVTWYDEEEEEDPVQRYNEEKEDKIVEL